LQEAEATQFEWEKKGLLVLGARIRREEEGARVEEGKKSSHQQQQRRKTFPPCMHEKEGDAFYSRTKEGKKEERAWREKSTLELRTFYFKSLPARGKEY